MSARLPQSAAGWARGRRGGHRPAGRGGAGGGGPERAGLSGEERAGRERLWAGLARGRRGGWANGSGPRVQHLPRGGAWRERSGRRRAGGRATGLRAAAVGPGIGGQARPGGWSWRSRRPRRGASRLPGAVCGARARRIRGAGARLRAVGGSLAVGGLPLGGSAGSTLFARSVCLSDRTALCVRPCQSVCQSIKCLLHLPPGPLCAAASVCVGLTGLCSSAPASMRGPCT